MNGDYQFVLWLAVVLLVCFPLAVGVAVRISGSSEEPRAQGGKHDDDDPWAEKGKPMTPPSYPWSGTTNEEEGDDAQ